MDKKTRIEGSLMLLDIADVIPTPDNPRPVFDNDPKILSMAESMKGPVGQKDPGIARPHPTRPGKYDLRDGERRLKAAKLAGRDKFLAIVRDMDDRTAKEVTLISFLHTEGLTPMQEAKAINELLGDGKDVEAIAADLGHTVAFVRRRAQLMKLTPEWLKAHGQKESKVHGWSAAHLEMIARFDPLVQDRILKSLDNEYHTPAWTLAQLADHVGDFMHLLRLAPWDLNDVGLVKKAGSCMACQKRSECLPFLFEEFASRKAGTSADKCLDAACWNKKDKAFLARKITLLREEHTDLVMINPDGGSSGKALGSWDYDAAKQKDKGAVPAVVVKGPLRGSLTWVKVKKTGEHKIEAAKPKSLKELRAELERKRSNDVCSKFGPALRGNKSVAKATDLDLLAWLVSIQDNWGPVDIQACQKLAKAGRKKILAAASEFIRTTCVDGLSTTDSARVVADLFGIDIKPMITAAAKAHPEPEEWANLKADGTLKSCPKCGHKPHESVCTADGCICVGRKGFSEI